MPLSPDWEERYLKEKQATLDEMAKLRVMDLLDEDGYPTDTALKLIEIWHWEDPIGWFDFIETIWTHAWCGWSKEIADNEFREGEKVTRYNISTIGWSGNESIIRSMEKNDMLWHSCWIQSRRGGHYIFEVEDEV